MATRSARALLLTVLGEFVRPGRGAAWTSTFIEVLARLGVEEKATRQALMRSADQGLLVARRAGRRTSWSLTPDATNLLTEGAERIYGFTAAQLDWDGRWLVVLARAPESERGARHRLRTRLAWAGLGSPSPGVWISSHPDRLAEVEPALAAAGVTDAQVFVGPHIGSGDTAAMVRAAWDLDAIDAAYRGFSRDFATTATRDPLVQMIELVHAWRRFPQLDPALPRELLPARWSGTKAAERFARQHARWARNAAAEWTTLDHAD